MNANYDLERVLADLYHAEGLLRAPNRVLDSALTTIETTPQLRAIRASWRFPEMTTYARIAVAAIALIGVVAVGYIFYSNMKPTIGNPSPSPTQTAQSTTATPSGTPAAPSASPSGSPSADLPLTERFESAINGVSLSYPSGWQVRAATQPWTSSEAPLFEDRAMDVMYDDSGELQFLGVASQWLGQRSGRGWSQEIAAGLGTDSDCPVLVDPGFIGDGSFVRFAPACPDDRARFAAAVSGGRAYLIVAYGVDDPDWFSDVLQSIEFDPRAAVGPTPLPPPGLVANAEFAVPFTYVLPEGPEFALGLANGTYYELRAPSWAEAGQPGGVILQVLRGVHADPCDRLSPIVLLEDLDTAPFDYLKTIPDLSVGNEFEAWIGDLPGSGAHAEATTEAPTCAELWPWSETTEAFTAIPRGTDVRLLTFYFDGQQLLFTVFGEDRIPDRRATIDELINSFRFAPSPRASVSGTIRVLLEMPFRFTLPDGMSLTAATSWPGSTSPNLYALTNGAIEPYPGFGFREIPGLRGLVFAFTREPSTHGDSYDDKVPLSTDSLLSDLTGNPMLNVGTSTPLEIDGVPAAWADIDVTGLAGSGYPHIDFGADERGIVDFAFPGRLFVIPSGDGVFLVHIYAGTDEDLAAWLPEASQIVESITFR